eukprot:6805957-Lingulodinium_polyedra.AAC.1
MGRALRCRRRRARPASFPSSPGAASVVGGSMGRGGRRARRARGRQGCAPAATGAEQRERRLYWASPAGSRLRYRVDRNCRGLRAALRAKGHLPCQYCATQASAPGQ